MSQATTDLAHDPSALIQKWRLILSDCGLPSDDYSEEMVRWAESVRWGQWVYAVFADGNRDLSAAHIVEGLRYIGGPNEWFRAKIQCSRLTGEVAPYRGDLPPEIAPDGVRPFRCKTCFKSWIARVREMHQAEVDRER